MKHITIILFIISFLLSSCSNEDSIVIEEINPSSELTTVRSIYGLVYEEYSLLSSEIKRQPISNVTVRLMHNGETLDEVNTDNQGSFTFVEQPVPEDEAYLIFDAPGFYKNAVKVIEQFDSGGRDITPNDYYFTLIRETFDEVDGGALTDQGPYIRLTMEPQMTSIPLYYITNDNNELIGARRNISPSTNFELTTLANVNLYLHYLTPCGAETIEMGPFSEDTDISKLVEEFTYALGEFETIAITANDCNGTTLPIDEWYKFYTTDGITRWDGNFSNFSYLADSDCFFEQNPNLLVSVAIQEPRLYGEMWIDYSGGAGGARNITLCEEDDTYLNYSLEGGPEVIPHLFTYANILPNGELLLKQKAPNGENLYEFSSYINDSGQGNISNGDIIIIDKPRGSFVTVSHVGDNVEFIIESNDGKFIEGTFEGSVYDGFEQSLGTIKGSFRARIL